MLAYETGTVGPPDVRAPEVIAEAEAEAARRRARARAASDARRVTEVAAADPTSADRNVTSPSQMAYELLTEVMPYAVGALTPDIADPRLAIESQARDVGRSIYGAVAPVASAVFGASPAGSALNALRGPDEPQARASLEFSPEALGSAAVPFSDEIGGTLDALWNDRQLTEALREAEARRSQAEHRYPGSAMAGMGAQGLVLGQLLGPAGNPGAATAGRSLWQTIASGGLAAAREAAPVGLIMGADRSTHSPTQAALMPGATPTSVGTEALGLSGDTMREGAIQGGLGLGLGGLFGGVGYGMRRAFGGAAPEAVAGMDREAFDRAVASAESADDAIANGTMPGIQDEAFDAIRPTAEGTATPPSAVSLTEPGRALAMNPHEAMLRAAGLRDRRQVRAAETLFGSLENAANRLDRYGIVPRGIQAAGVPESEAIRRATAMREAAGSGLQEVYGQFPSRVGMPTLPRSIEGDPGFADLSDIVAQWRAESQRLRNVRAAGSDAAADIIDAQIARVMDDPRNMRIPRLEMPDTMADFGRPSPGPLNEQFGTLRALRATMRRGPMAEPFEGTLPPDPNAAPEPWMGETLEPPTPATEYDIQPMADMSELNAMMRDLDTQRMDILSGARTTDPTPRHSALGFMRSSLNRGRDEMIQRAFGDEQLANVRRLRDMYATGAMVSPPRGVPIAQQRPPVGLSARILGAPLMLEGARLGFGVGGPMGAVAGGAAGLSAGVGAANLMREYEYPILAAINNGRGSLTQNGIDVAADTLSRLRGQPAAASRAAELAGLESAAASDVTDLGDEGLNLMGRARRVPTATREALGITPEVYDTRAQPALDNARRVAGQEGLAWMRQPDEAPPAAPFVPEHDYRAEADRTFFTEPTPGAPAPAEAPHEGEPDYRAETDRSFFAEPDDLAEELPADPNVLPGVVKTEPIPPADTTLPNIRKFRNRRATP
jgi:hypothetical protein